jgi:hypothetical protein
LNGIDPVVSVSRQPEWRVRVDFLLAEQPTALPATLSALRRSPPVLSGNPGTRSDRAAALQDYLAVTRNHAFYTDRWRDGSEVVGLNNIGEITFRLDDKLNPDGTPATTPGGQPIRELKVVHDLWWRLRDAADAFPLTRCAVVLEADPVPPPLP